MKPESRFLALWILAVVSATAAFVLHLALRVRSVELGYELGRTHAHVARLREVEHVLELELASHKTPERVEFVARTLLGMGEPSADRILPAGVLPREAADAVAPNGPSADAPTSPAAVPTKPGADAATKPAADESSPESAP